MSIGIVNSLMNPSLPTGASNNYFLSANLPYGFVSKFAIYMKLRDGVDGAPSTLLQPLSYGENAPLAVNSIVRRREAEFGVVQANSWMAKIGNGDGYFFDYDLRGAVCVGSLTDFSWSKRVFTGSIRKSAFNSDRTLTIEVMDALADLMRFGLPRDVGFGPEPWISEIIPLEVSLDSKGWNNDPVINNDDPTIAPSPGYTYHQVAQPDVDYTFILQFASATTFDVILEDGSTGQSGISITSVIESIKGPDGVTNFATLFPSFGFSSASGAYESGDQFVFHVSRPRTAQELTPIYMIIHILEDIVGFDFWNEQFAYIPSIRYDLNYWASKANEYDDPVYTIGGAFEKGTPVINMIQDLLKLVHGSIYTVAEGPVGLWVLSPSTEEAIELNGDPSRGPVQIISGSAEYDSRDIISEAVYSYKRLGSAYFHYPNDERSVRVKNDSTPDYLTNERVANIDIAWEVNDAFAKSACDLYMTRFGETRERYRLQCTPGAGTLNPGDQVRIFDPDMGAVGAQTDIVGVGYDPIALIADVECFTEVTTLSEYARCDQIASVVGSTVKVVW